MSTRLATLLAVVLVLVILVPQSNASFTTNPTFDLKTNSNIAGATDAVYTLHLENKDKSQDTLSVSITIPAGYAISQKFITDKTGVRAGSAYGHCPAGSATASLATTATPGRFKISFMGMAQSDVIVIEPTAATPGTMEFSFTGTYAVMNSGCYADVTTVEGFFVNPSTLGTYIWAPSMATPRSGPAVEMVPRSGLSQTVTIVGAGVTTTATTTETETPATTQTETSTSVQVATSTSTQTTPVQTTVHMTSSEAETPTTTEAPQPGQLPMELIAAAIVGIVVVAAGAALALRRRK